MNGYAKALADEMNKEIVPTDPEFESKFATATVSQTHLQRYYLRALNQGYDAQEPYPARVSKRGWHVEHILPLNPTDAWNHFQPDEAKAFVKRIGNLTLLPPRKNTDAGNADFLKVKVPIYRDATSIPLTMELASLTKWDAKAIEERQKRLAALAVKVWPAKVK